MNQDEVNELVKEFIQEMKELGIKVHVQYMNEKGQMFSQCSMNVISALGSLEVAKETVLHGMRGHQIFDGFVQAIEARPELVERINKAMHKDI